MALIKTVEYDKIEIVGDYKTVQCREATIIKEDGVELTRSFQRHILTPSSCTEGLDDDGNPDGTYTHTDTDISDEPAETQAVCNAVWTDAIKTGWKTFCESNAAART